MDVAPTGNVFKKAMRWFVDMFEFETSNCLTVREILEKHGQRDSVRYLVLFGHDLKHYGSIQFYVYKVPKHLLVSELLEHADKLQTESHRAATETAASELSQEIHELDE